MLSMVSNISSLEETAHSQNWDGAIPSNIKSLKNIVIIDSQVEAYDELADNIIFPDEVYILDGDRDGISQITEFVRSHTSYNLHIIAHGTSGCIFLGNSQLSLETLEYYNQDLQQWQAAQLLLYSCDVASGSAGAEFIDRLHQLTKIEIAASTTPIGNPSLGGDWELDYATTALDLPSIFTPEIQASYPSLLAISVTAPTSNSQWVAIPAAGTNAFDFAKDQQTGSTESDLVGTSNNSMLYMAFDPTNPVDPTNPNASTDGTLAFRVRVGADADAAGFKGSFFVGIDANLDGKVDLFVGVANSGNPNSIAIWKPGTGLNISPSTTSIVSPPIQTYPEDDSNYQFAAVNVVDSGTTIPLSDINNDSKTDHFLSFSLPFNDIVKALKGLGFPVTDQSAVRFILGTATQDNSINQDIGGVQGGTTSGLSFEALGAYSVITQFDGTPVNDAPFNRLPAIAQATDQNVPLVFSTANANPIRINDPDAGSSDVQVTLSSQNGILQLGSTANLTSFSGDGTNTITLEGSLVNINAALEGLRFSPTTDFQGNGSITVTTNDLGNTGIGGAKSDTDTFTITVNNSTINNAPINTVPEPQIVDEPTNQNPTKIIFSSASGNALGVTDSDAGSGIIQVSLVASMGSLTLGSTTGLASFTGNTSANIVLTGTVAAINTALEGLQYTPPNNPSSNATLTMTTNDQGHSGTGGALSDVDVVTIIIAHPTNNEAPVLDLNGSNAGSNFSTTFVKDANSVAVAIAASGATAIDSDGIDIETLTLTFSGFSDGISEILKIANSSFPVGTGTTGVVTIGGTTFTLSMANSTTMTIAKQGGGAIANADVQSLLRSIYYENTDTTPTIGNRTISIIANDGTENSDLVTSTITVSVINSLPDAINDSFSTNEDTVLSNTVVDSNSGDAPATYSLNGQATNGTAVVNLNGTFTYTPNANFFGTDSFSYKLTDGNGDTDTATVTITVNPINDRPTFTGSAIAMTTTEDATPTIATVASLFGSSFSDGADVVGSVSGNSFAGVALAANGATASQGRWEWAPSGSTTWTAIPTDLSATSAYVLAADAQIRFVPIADYNGTPGSLTVRVIDDSQGAVVPMSRPDVTLSSATQYSSSGNTLTVTVAPVNDAPALNSLGGSVSFTENGSAVVLDNEATVSDIDLDGLNNWAGATLTLQRQGGANSQDSFAHALTSLAQGSTVSVGSTAIATVTTNSNGTLTLTFNSNATAALVSTALQQITYRNSSEKPPASVVVAYTLNDGNTGVQGTGGPLTANGAVTVNITPVNDAPILTAGATLTYTENQTAQVIDNIITLADSDDTQIVGATVQISSGLTSGDTLSAISTATISATYSSGTGLLTLTGIDSLANYQQILRSITYSSSNDDPTLNSSTRTITWQVTDANSDGMGATNSVPVTSTINVVPLNDNPVNTVPSDQSATEDIALVFSTANGNAFSINDRDARSDNLEVMVSGTKGILAVSNSSSGATVTNNNSASITLRGSLTQINAALDGLSYQGNADFNGTDTLTILTSDLGHNGTGGIRTDSDTVVIRINAIADIVADTAIASEDLPLTIAVLNNDSFEGTPVISNVTSGSHGTVSISSGRVIYTPHADYNGSDSFTYTITSGGVTETETVNVTVNAIADALNDTLVTNEDAPQSINVLNNDTFQPGARVTEVTQGNNGGVTFNADGTVTYTPNSNFYGNDSFTYKVISTAGNVETATVNVTVNSVNDAPLATDDSFSISEDTVLTLNSSQLVGNDHDPENRTLTIISVQDAVNGMVSFENGFITFIPTANYVGRASFTYSISDGQGGTATATVNVAVGAFPDAIADNFTIDEDTSLTSSVRDSDEGIAPAIYRVDTTVSHGTLNFNSDGSFIYTPYADYNGTDSFTYIVTDANGHHDTATATIVVGAIADATNDTLTATGVSPKTMDVLANDTFRSEVQLIAVTQGSRGSVVINLDGSVTYAAQTGFGGTDSFTYTVRSATGNLETATVNVLVNLDTDGDGIANIDDLDDDNDSILDTIEDRDNPDRDTDHDGVLDRLDLDSDNDGLLDIREADHPLLDTNGDGHIDSSSSSFGTNGYLNSLETFPDSGIPRSNLPNTDGDTVPDFQDLDSDNDGISDVIEGGGSDPNGDAIVGSGVFVDTNGNGILDTLEPGLGGSPLSIPDQDRDGTPNFRDLDSDNDGIFDVTEAGRTSLDTNGDGSIDGPDIDSDGLPDTIDGSTSTFGSVLSPLTPPIDGNGNGIPDFLEPPTSTSGSPGPDVISGTNGDDILNGFSDNDSLHGLGGNDIINGGSSQDVMWGDEGNDQLNGGSGDDRMDGGTGNDRLAGGSGNDLLIGGYGNDLLDGGTGNDRLYGNGGADILNGGDDQDRLYGSAGNDRLRGNRGNDLLVGGVGRDTLTGGQGSDRFIYTHRSEFQDIITDFEIRKDRIDLSRIQGVNSMRDLRLLQSGDDVLLKVRAATGFQLVASIENVQANTLSQSHFIL